MISLVSSDPTRVNLDVQVVRIAVLVAGRNAAGSAALTSILPSICLPEATAAAVDCSRCSTSALTLATSRSQRLSSKSVAGQVFDSLAVLVNLNRLRRL